jgi:hypothetical protein
MLKQSACMRADRLLPQEPPADLHRLTNLKTLSVTSCRMKTLGAAQLHMLPCLEVLDLSSNNLGGEGSQYSCRVCHGVLACRDAHTCVALVTLVTAASVAHAWLAGADASSHRLRILMPTLFVLVLLLCCRAAICHWQPGQEPQEAQRVR